LFLSSVIPLDTIWAEKTVSLFGQTSSWKFGSQQIVAVGIILFLSAINCLRVSVGARLQSVLTLGKVFAIGILVVGVFFFSHGANWENLIAPPGHPAWTGFKAFGAAM